MAEGQRMAGYPTPLVKIGPLAGYTNIFVKDESVNPTGTFKDRLAFAAIHAVPPDSVIAAISYGNTALSLMHALSHRTAIEKQLRGCVLVPEDLHEWELGPTSLGTTLSGRELLNYLRGRLEVVPLPSDGRVLDDSGVAELVRSVLPDALYIENITEGISTPCYRPIIEESVTQLGREPDVCLVPYGAGILCNEVRDFLAGGDCEVVALSVSRQDSIARMLYGPIWVSVSELAANGYAYSRHRSPDRTGAPRQPYRVYDVAEDEVRSGLATAAALQLSAEPSGSVGLGVLERLSTITPKATPDADILVINTGNGIDPLAQADWIR